jgi:hypothetical protein
MDGIYLIFCLAMIMFLAVVALVIAILKSDSGKDPQKTAVAGRLRIEEQKGETPAIKAGETKDLSPQIHLERSREFMERYNAAEAKKHALAAFHSRDREIRLQAVKLLSTLHEVEEF